MQEGRVVVARFLIPTCFGFPLPQVAYNLVSDEFKRCGRCNDELGPTGVLRTYQLALSWILNLENNSYYTITFDCLLLCSGCNSLPFLYTIFVNPGIKFGQLSQYLNKAWPDMEYTGTDATEYLLSGLTTLQYSSDLLHGFTQKYVCSQCFKKGKDVRTCSDCNLVLICDKCKGAIHRFVCGAICENGGIFDLNNIHYIREEDGQ